MDIKRGINVKTMADAIEARNATAEPPKRFVIPYDENDVYLLLGSYYKAEVLKRRQSKDYVQATPEMRDNIRNVARWLCDPSKRCGLMLYGSVGTGKTTLLYAIRSVINSLCTRESDDQGHIEIVLDPPFAMSIVKAKRIIDDYQLARLRYDLMCRVAILGIDELGVESTETKLYGNVSEPIIDLLSDRYDGQRCTIISTNMGEAELRERYGKRMLDRFAEMFATIPFTTKSFRQ